jgi:hypothetical protein
MKKLFKEVFKTTKKIFKQLIAEFLIYRKKWLVVRFIISKNVFARLNFYYAEMQLKLIRQNF